MKTYKSVAVAVLVSLAFYGIFVKTQAKQPRRSPRRVQQALDKNEASYPYHGVISGRVLLDDGQPAVGFPVTARFVRHMTGALGEGSAVTDAEGYYSIHRLSPQDFYVTVSNEGKGYVPDPPYTVHLKDLPGQTAEGTDFTLHRGPQITVRVRNAQTGAPVPGVKVQTQPPLAESDAQKVTDANGELSFRSGSLETDVQITQPPGNRLYIGAAPGSTLQRYIRFKSAADIRDVDWDIKIYSGDPKLSYLPFRGTVTGPNGEPAAYATVHLYRGGSENQTRANKDGQFVFEQQARMEPYEDKQPGESGHSRIMLRAEIRDLSGIHFATPEETWTSIPVQLGKESRATLMGQAVDLDGKAQANVPLSYMESPHGAGTGIWENVGTTDQNGNFLVSLKVHDSEYELILGQRAHDGNPTGWGPTKIGWDKIGVLQPGEQHQLGRVVLWKADGEVSGVVSSRKGKIAKNSLMVVVRGAHTDRFDYPNEKGEFHVRAVAHEPLMLYVFQSEGEQGFRTTPGNPDEVARAKVQAGDNSINLTVP